MPDSVPSAYTPVEGDPWAGYTLMPVDGDPFAEPLTIHATNWKGPVSPGGADQVAAMPGEGSPAGPLQHAYPPDPSRGFITPVETPNPVPIDPLAAFSNLLYGNQQGLATSVNQLSRATTGLPSQVANNIGQQFAAGSDLASTGVQNLKAGNLVAGVPQTMLGTLGEVASPLAGIWHTIGENVDPALDPGVGDAAPHIAPHMVSASDVVPAALAGIARLPSEIVDRGPATAEKPPIIAYHGTPHDFDQFRWDPEVAGTGEGAQAYGHGLYFAENEGVAKGYRDALARGDKQWFVDGQSVGTYGQNNSPLGSAAARIRQVMPADGIVTADDAQAALLKFQDVHARNKGMIPAKAFQDTSQAIQQLVGRHVSESSPGHVYQVGINADPEHFLDWDKPVEQQSPLVQHFLAANGAMVRDHVIAPDDPFAAALSALDMVFPHNGSSAHRMIAEKFGGDAKAAEAMKEAGIPGIRFLDAGSRGGGNNGTRNYVVFDAKTIAILKKYGLAGLGIGLGGTAAGMLGQPNQAQAAPSYTTLTPVDRDPFAQ